MFCGIFIHTSPIDNKYVSPYQMDLQAQPHEYANLFTQSNVFCTGRNETNSLSGHKYYEMSSQGNYTNDYSYNNLYVIIKLTFINLFKFEELKLIRNIIIGTFKDLEQELSTSDLAVSI